MRRSSRQSPVIAAILLVLGAAAVLVKSGGGALIHHPIVPKEVEVYFSPKGGCTDAIVSTLQSARKSVWVQAYSFTSPQIARALVDAHRRGLDVKIILDKSEQTDKYSEADFTSHAGIPTWIDSQHNIAHNKIIIVDGETVVTGSFNFTRQAEEHNAENLLIIHQTPALASSYIANWLEHQSHSAKYR